MCNKTLVAKVELSQYVKCEPLVFSWIVIMLMHVLDLCNECNDLVGIVHNFI
jgi:hypothetical protein